MAKRRANPESKTVRTVGSIVFVILLVLVGLPIAFVAFAAFSDTLPRPGNISLGNLSLETIQTVFTGGTLDAAMNSILAAFGAALVALVIGTLLAILATRTNLPGKRFIQFAGISPLFIPAFVAALAWSLIGSPQSGLINILMFDLDLPFRINIYSMGGLVFVLGAYYAPYVFMFVSSALALMNPELEEASLVHGASMWETIRKVTLSLMTPAILGSTFLVFILAIENFPVAQFLATPGRIDTLPTYIYRYMSESPPRGNEAAALALMLVAIVLILTWIQRRILARRDYTTLSGKGSKRKMLDLGKWRWPLFVVVGVWFTITIVLPVGTLLIVSSYSSPYIPTITGMFESGGLSLSRLAEPVTNSMVLNAMANSTIVSILTAVVATLLAFAITYLVYRTKITWRSGLENLSMAPLAIPAIVMGMGLLWTWLVLPVPIYGTLIILVVAFTATQIPQAFRGMSGSMLQVNKELEESALMHGSTRIRAISTITAPLMKTGIGSTFVLMLMLSLRELTVPLFLYNTNTRLLSIVIFDQYENGAMQNAAALGVWYILLIAIIATVASRFGFRAFDHN